MSELESMRSRYCAAFRYNDTTNYNDISYTVEAAYCGHLGPGTSVRIIRLSRIDGEAQKHTNLILKNPEIWI